MSALYDGPIIDAHHHLWDLSLARHPWLTSDDTAVKPLGNIDYMRKTYLPADYLADVGPQNVVGSVYIEALWDRTRPPVEEIAWLESLARPRAIAASSIGWTNLRADDAEAVLDALAAHPSVCGLRETIRWHPDPARSWTERGLVDDPAWRRGLAFAAARGLHLELLMNMYQVDEVARLAKEFPGQRFVVNHCGTPDRDPEGMATWRAALPVLAAAPNVFIKLSAYQAYAADHSLPALRAVVAPIVDAFGTSRAMFGTDYPVGRRHMSFQDMCENFKAIVADFSADEQRALFHDTAARVYRFT